MKFLAVNTMKNADGSISELAAVLWDTKTQTIWDDYSVIVKSEIHSDDAVEEDLAIPAELRTEKGSTVDNLFKPLLKIMAEKADFFVSYGSFYTEHMAIQKLFNTKGIAGVDKNWCYLVDDLELLSSSEETMGLARFLRKEEVNICLPLPRRAASRALAVAQLTQMFFDEVSEALKSPYCVVKADVSYEDRDQAKSAGFRWQKLPQNDKKEYKGSWVKMMRSHEIEKFEKKYKLSLIVLERL